MQLALPRQPHACCLLLRSCWLVDCWERWYDQTSAQTRASSLCPCDHWGFAWQTACYWDCGVVVHCLAATAAAAAAAAHYLAAAAAVAAVPDLTGSSLSWILHHQLLGQTATAPAHTGARIQPAVEHQHHKGGSVGKCQAPDGVAALERQLAYLPGPGMPEKALVGQGLVPAGAAQLMVDRSVIVLAGHETCDTGSVGTE